MRFVDRDKVLKGFVDWKNRRAPEHTNTLELFMCYLSDCNWLMPTAHEGRRKARFETSFDNKWKFNIAITIRDLKTLVRKYHKIEETYALPLEIKTFFNAFTDIWYKIHNADFERRAQ